MIIHLPLLPDYSSQSEHLLYRLPAHHNHNILLPCAAYQYILCAAVVHHRKANKQDISLLSDYCVIDRVLFA